MPDAVVPTLIIAALILLNGLFVAAEFAIVGAPRPAIARRAANGDLRARLVAAILGDARALDRFIATAQLGITLASLGLGMYGEHLLATWLAGVFEGLGTSRWVTAHTLGSIMSITILTYFHIVIGEMVPKSLALQQAERLVLWIAPVMRAIQVVAYPLVVSLNGVGNGILRFVRVQRSAHTSEHYQTPKELAYLVHEAQVGGLLASEPARVVAELLSFSELTARELQVPRVRVVAIPLGAGVHDLNRILRERPFTRYPVYDGTIDRIAGMVHVKDILRCMSRGAALTREHIRSVPFVPEAASSDQVIASMRLANSQMVVVLDEHGGTSGIITAEDLFEEVVGDVSDDSPGDREVRRSDDGSVMAVGVARLEAVGEALGVELSHDDVQTVNGLVLMLLGRPPRSGDAVTYRGVRIEVRAVAGHGASEVRARIRRENERSS
jgi:CBS domain containing-hemolysin-like protein